MHTVRLEVLASDGWTTATFEDITQLCVAGAPGDDGLMLVVIGVREDMPNQVATGILDIAERHRSLLDSELPTIDGTAVPVAQRE